MLAIGGAFACSDELADADMDAKGLGRWIVTALHHEPAAHHYGRVKSSDANPCPRYLDGMVQRCRRRWHSLAHSRRACRAVSFGAALADGECGFGRRRLGFVRSRRTC